MRKTTLKRKALGLTIATLLLAFSVPIIAPAQADSETTNDFIPIAQVSFVPCANGGAGELVSVSGILHVLSHATINDNRVNLKQQFQPQGATAIGLSTGDVYRAVGGTRFHDTFPLTNGATTFTFVNNFRMIGPGTDNNLQVHQNIHTTINANGDVTSTVNNTSIDCN